VCGHFCLEGVCECVCMLVCERERVCVCGHFCLEGVCDYVCMLVCVRECVCVGIFVWRVCVSVYACWCV